MGVKADEHRESNGTRVESTGDGNLIPVLLHLDDYIGFSNILVMTICGGIYSVASVECVMCICERSETRADNLFFISVMLLSVPIITLLLVSDSLDGTVQQAFTSPLA